MPYRKVDDTFDGHPKVRKLVALGKRRCGAAVALWTLAGCEARREVGRGKPPSVALLYVTSAPVEAPLRAASDLAAVGLWVRCDDAGGARWVFHDEEDWNLSGDRILRKRHGDRDRQRKHREGKRKAADEASHSVTGCDVTTSRPDQARPDQTKENPPTPLGGKARGKPAPQVVKIFELWRRLWQKTAATKLDKKRQRAIERALADYDVEIVTRCLTGYASSPFHRGENDTETIHDSITLHLRDADHIERGLRYAEAGKSGAELNSKGIPKAQAKGWADNVAELQQASRDLRLHGDTLRADRVETQASEVEHAGPRKWRERVQPNPGRRRAPDAGGAPTAFGAAASGARGRDRHG